jgi:hypothetical protein
MEKITIKIQDLNCDDTDLSNLNDKTVESITGSGIFGAFASTFIVTAGIGINGLRTGQSGSSILQQQIDYGVPAFAVGFFLPEP